MGNPLKAAGGLPESGPHRREGREQPRRRWKQVGELVIQEGRARAEEVSRNKASGKRGAARKETASSSDVLIYFWDDRDGPDFCGWWFGPHVGGYAFSNPGA